MEQAGVIALSMPGHLKFGKATNEEKEAADWLHKEKIMMSDFIYVIDTDTDEKTDVVYMGDSTRSELLFALQLKVPVFYHSNWRGDIKGAINQI